ncbi:EAL domain, c-di-GMP-specific phosphodiesterase class I (or its enzymatically inactive variant) [Williamsia serinedens]|uniref:EAL domain, c-di-GMP-specific phosphodiesterase class I (Or its enzymatically inactive variant) n=2 Tax=Williamsia serinedens TaxID=391736 RepID=A0ABT1H2D1_9NOCA|nr:EAL domain, c-di-GMP-specific phosphodiesterase class I (or its enzymatically inactive variant) [Williamsia serinedens]
MQFAPVRRLSDGALAAAELRLRGTHHTRIDQTEDLLRAAGLMSQQVAAPTSSVRGTATAVDVADTLPLLVSIDMDVTESFTDDDLHPLAKVVVCVSPDDVIAHPHRCLRTIADARDRGRLICVDDMGSTENALAMLPLIEPDIIITPPELLARMTDPDMADLANALQAYIERSHAVLVAEGVDSDDLREAALTAGAGFGVGALYPAVDDPRGFVGEPVVALPDAPVWNTPRTELPTPYAIASQGVRPRRGTKQLLIEMSKSLEAQAAGVGHSMIVIGTFQHKRHFTTETSKRWHLLSEATGFAGVYGVGLEDRIEGNVQHAPLAPEDDLVNEWTVAVLGPHYAALLSARDLHDNGPDLDRTFDFVQSFDRVTVTQAVNSILSRFTG